MCENAETSACSSCARPDGSWQFVDVHRTVHQRIGILGKYLVIEEIIVVEEQKISRQPVVALDRRSIDLRNARVEEPESGANHQRTLVPDRVCQPDAGREVPVLYGTRPASGHSGLRLQSFRGERLQVVARSQAQGKMVGDADRVLQKSGVLVRVRMGDGGPKLCR